MKKLNLKDKKYKMVTAIKPTKERQGSSIIWLCKCDCGNIKEISTSNLTLGRIKSCGCLSKEKIIERNISRTIHGHSTIKRST